MFTGFFLAKARARARASLETRIRRLREGSRSAFPSYPGFLCSCPGFLCGFCVRTWLSSDITTTTATATIPAATTATAAATTATTGSLGLILLCLRSHARYQLKSVRVNTGLVLS